MIQKYEVDEILIHRTSKQLIQVVDVIKDFDYHTFYDYECRDLENHRIERKPQSYLENKYMSGKDIEREVLAHEKEMNKLNDEIVKLKCLKEDMRDLLKFVKFVDDRKDSKR